MKLTKNVLAGSVAAAAMTFTSLAPVANAEVSGSVGVASTYFWRGTELGSGTPAVSGSLDYTEGGFYAGIWGSSGDGTAGTEYDLYLGYGGSAGDFSYDLGLITYVYPSGAFTETEGTPGDFAEFILTLGYGPVTFKYYDNIAGDTGGYALPEDYTYLSLAAEFGAFSVLVGQHDEAFGDYSHIDFSYAYNDNLSFTLSSILSGDAYGAAAAVPGTTTTPPVPASPDIKQGDRQEPLFVVSYSLPIK